MCSFLWITRILIKIQAEYIPDVSPWMGVLVFLEKVESSTIRGILQCADLTYLQFTACLCVLVLFFFLFRSCLAPLRGRHCKTVWACWCAITKKKVAWERRKDTKDKALTPSSDVHSIECFSWTSLRSATVRAAPLSHSGAAGDFLVVR